MTTEKIIDAIGMVNGEYVAGVHKPIVKIKHRGLKKICTCIGNSIMCFCSASCCNCFWSGRDI